MASREGCEDKWTTGLVLCACVCKEARVVLALGAFLHQHHPWAPLAVCVHLISSLGSGEQGSGTALTAGRGKVACKVCL